MSMIADEMKLYPRGACHLEARMVKEPLLNMASDGLDFIFIENVGNLICPFSYEFGESLLEVLLSAPEGHDTTSPRNIPGLSIKRIWW